jgi:hypothetical protein
MSKSLTAVDPRLTELSTALSEWRRNHRPRSPIPEELWSRAVALAQELGFADVFRATKLDYYALKRRVQGGRGAVVPAPGSATFVEFRLGAQSEPSARPCVVALSDRGGRSLRIEWSVTGAEEVAALARGLWEAAR